MRTVQAFGAESRSATTYGHAIGGALKAGIKAAGIQGASLGSLMIVMFGSCSLVLMLLGLQSTHVSDAQMASRCGMDQS